MGILARYILKEYVKIFLLTLSTLVIIYLTIDFFEKIRRFAEHDAGSWPVLLFFTLKIPRIIFEMTPVAILLSTVLVMGYFSRTREIIAIKACGISIHRVLAPLLVLGLLLGSFLLLANWSAIAMANRHSKHIRDAQIEKKAPSAFFRQQRVWLRLDRQTLLHVQLIEPSQEALYGVSLYRLGPDFTLEESLEAAEMRFRDGRWEMINGVHRAFRPDLSIEMESFETYPVALERKPSEFQGIMLREYEMTYSELDRYQAQLIRNGLDASRYQVEMASRAALPFIGFIMLLIGIPSGLLGGMKAGVAKGIGICLLIALAYWVFFSVSTSLGRGGVLPPLLAAWLPNITFGSVGALFFLQIRQ